MECEKTGSIEMAQVYNSAASDAKMEILVYIGAQKESFFGPLISPRSFANPGRRTEMFRTLTQFKRNACILFAVFLSNAGLAVSATTSGSLAFSNLPLVIPAGASEPAIAIGRDG